MIKYIDDDLPRVNVKKKHKHIMELSIDKSHPWGFLDGPSMGNRGLGRAGRCIYISDNHWISYFYGLRRCTNR
jgi:hypothetical protein